MVHHEIERSYRPAPGAELPDAAGLPGVTAFGDAVAEELEASYFDTPDRALLRVGVTLRRRTGGEDAGWHLTLPAGEGRDELRLPLSRARRVPPKPLRETVTGWTRGADLVRVATLTTRRTSRALLDGDGTVLAQLAEDRVEGRALVPETREPVRWREWELELVDGTPALLEAADELFAGLGAPPADGQVKLARVVEPPVPPHPPLPEPRKRAAARLVLHAWIVEQVAELGRRDTEVRRGDPEGVHKARVACRRLRGALATYRPLVDRDVTDPIRAELRWLAHALGDARDLDVAHARLLALVDEQPAPLVVGPVRRRLDESYKTRRKAAHREARDVLGSERYLVLREQLDRLAAAPPWTGRAEEEARDVLPPRVSRELRRVRRRVRSARRATGPAEHDAAMHATRRAAKRLRYAAEALEPVWGKDAARLAKAAKEMASTLGIRQDAVVTRPDLYALASAATAAGESAFTYGLLHAEERRVADAADDQLPELWERLTRPKLRAWL